MDVCRTCMTRNNLSPLFSYSFESEQLYIATGVNNTQVSTPFGVETLVPWGPAALELYRELAKRLVEFSGDQNAGLYFGQNISLCIQRGNAASILATYPSTKITRDDGLPQLICPSCIDTISNTLNLREVSIQVDNTLRKLLAMKLLKNYDNIDNDSDVFDSIDQIDSDTDNHENDIDSNDSNSKIEVIIENGDNETDCKEEKCSKNRLSDSGELSNTLSDSGELSYNVNDFDGVVSECKSILKMDGTELQEKVKEERNKTPIITKTIRKTGSKMDNTKYLALAVTPYDIKGPIQCKLCLVSLKTISQFKGHARTHFEPEFPCDQCPRKFYTSSFLKYHKQRLHGHVKRLKCDHCTFRAVDRECLQNHVYSVHTGERPFVCSRCDATFRRKIVLKQHMRVHSEEINVQCEICSSMFKSKSQLWKHRQQVHLLRFTYHCYLCTATYKRPLPVRRHIVKVHGIPKDQQSEIKCVKTKK